MAPTLIAFLSFSAGLLAEEKADLSKVPLPSGLVAPTVEAERAALVCFFEGPAVDEKGNVFFSDITANRILKMTARGEVSVFRADSGRANGNAFDPQGRLITWEGFG